MTDLSGTAGDLRQRVSSGALPLLARIAICLIFIQAVLGKIFGWSGQAAYMARHGISHIPPLLAAALAIELIGVVCLLLGYQVRLAALVMAVYLCIVSVMLHNFWAAGLSEMASGINQTEFLKNMGIVGGLLMIVAWGPGRFSLEEFLRRRQDKVTGDRLQVTAENQGIGIRE